MPPDASDGALSDTDASERRALEAAVAEAWASVAAGRVTPHAEVRAELLDFIARARRRVAELDGQASP